MSSLTCPKCDFEIKFKVSDCPRCGVVFAKWNATAMPAQGSRPTTGPRATMQPAPFAAPASAPAPASPSWAERTAPRENYPVWLAFVLPIVLVAGGVFLYRIAAISALHDDLLRAAKPSLEEFAKGQGEPTAIAKAVGRADTAVVEELKAGLKRELKARGALAGVNVEEVDVDVTDEGEVSVEVQYRARVAGIPSMHTLALADSFMPVKPEPPAPARTDLTTGVNIPYARPVTATPRPFASRRAQTLRVYQPPGARPTLVR